MEPRLTGHSEPEGRACQEEGRNSQCKGHEADGTWGGAWRCSQSQHGGDRRRRQPWQPHMLGRWSLVSNSCIIMTDTPTTSLGCLFHLHGTEVLCQLQRDENYRDPDPHLPRPPPSLFVAKPAQALKDTLGKFTSTSQPLTIRL